MKLTITKANGTKMIKEFRESDISDAKANGWEEVGSKPKAKKITKEKKEGK